MCIQVTHTFYSYLDDSITLFYRDVVNLLLSEKRICYAERVQVCSPRTLFRCEIFVKKVMNIPQIISYRYLKGQSISSHGSYCKFQTIPPRRQPAINFLHTLRTLNVFSYEFLRLFESLNFYSLTEIIYFNCYCSKVHRICYRK